MLMLKLVILYCCVQAGRMNAITIRSDQRHTTTVTAVLTSLGAKKWSNRSCTACGTNRKTHQKVQLRALQLGCHSYTGLLLESYCVPNTELASLTCL